ncbi:MAG: 3-hydroxyacyl-CoA dehydrogenase [Bacteroidetes bacterium]|nr:MAG: 3-hydroxyacyl-CoA dehydrogenase [Bacteroidota bacterium]
MRIALIGPEDRIAEWQQRLPHIEPVYVATTPPPFHDRPDIDLVFDLDLDQDPERMAAYAPVPGLMVIGCAVKRTLAELALWGGRPPAGSLVGLNALPTFLHRPAWEFSLYQSEDRERLELICNELDLAWEIVEDRLGMVTPRVLAMIINEACTLVQEGTASPGDIDAAMRLGTNYPLGPLAWAAAIGPEHLVELLDLLRQETGEGRFRVAPLLRNLLRRGEWFDVRADA